MNNSIINKMSVEKKKSDTVDLESILQELGHFGKYQFYNYSMIIVAIMFSACYGANYVFTAADVNYRCRIDECEGNNTEWINASWLESALPVAASGLQRCRRYAPLNTTAPGTCPADFDHDQMVICDAYVYESRNTIVYEFDLGCEDWKRTLVGTVHSAGLLAALPITGYISDRHGRKVALCIAAVLAGVFGVMRSFSTSYIIYLILEFLEATLGSGVYSAGIILALELVGHKQRVAGGNIIAMAYAVGQMLLGSLAWAVPDWRTLTRIIYAPSLLFVLYAWLIQESVRWLLSKGKKQEAVDILLRAAEINNRTLSPAVLDKLTKDDNVREGKEVSDKDFREQSLVYKVLRSRTILTRLCICSFWWITVTFVYYGLSINAMSLAGNSYVNYILVSSVEIPGYTLSILSLDRFGRKSSMMVGFLICGVACISLPFLPIDLPWLSTLLYLIGKLSISMNFSSLYIYTSELFPTYLRHSLLGFCSMVGRIGSIVAPQMPLLAIYMESLPSLLFGSFALISGTLMILTPETLNTRLPDTIGEAEDIGTIKNSSKVI